MPWAEDTGDPVWWSPGRRTPEHWAEDVGDLGSRPPLLETMTTGDGVSGVKDGATRGGARAGEARLEQWGNTRSGTMEPRPGMAHVEASTPRSSPDVAALDARGHDKLELAWVPPTRRQGPCTAIATPWLSSPAA